MFRIENEGSFFNTATKYRKFKKFGLIRHLPNQKAVEGSMQKPRSNPNIFTAVLSGTTDLPFQESRPVGISKAVFNTIKCQRQHQNRLETDICQPHESFLLKGPISATALQRADKVKRSRTEIVHDYKPEQNVDELFKHHKQTKIIVPISRRKLLLDNQDRTNKLKRGHSQELAIRKTLSQASSYKMHKPYISIQRRNQEHLDKKAVLGELDFIQDSHAKCGDRFFESSLRDNFEQKKNAHSSFTYQISDEIKMTPLLRMVANSKPGFLFRQRLVLKGHKSKSNITSSQ